MKERIIRKWDAAGLVDGLRGLSPERDIFSSNSNDNWFHGQSNFNGLVQNIVYTVQITGTTT